ncbi:nucleotide-diphospho-sugar transferase [Obelidium mucronatum]|nr:nucleotide-diphospho-sugar transferase [Obelidium mucronatum]
MDAHYSSEHDTHKVNVIPGNRLIPKIIHQSWKTDEVPDKYINWTRTWQRLNPDYEYKLWTDADNRNLIVTDYPWFLETFDSFEDPIMRADSSRVFYMHKYGGVYADLDFECLKPLDTLLASHHAVLGSMSVGMNLFLYAHSIPNAFMSSKPGHPMWMQCAKRIMSNRKGSVEQITGPAMLYRCYKNYAKSKVAKEEPVYVAPPEYIFPFSWTQEKTKGLVDACYAMRSHSLNTTKCLDYVDPERKAYAITYWGHSWAPAY